MNLPLFCFGSLMDPDVLACVIDMPVPARITFQPAEIDGYRKVRLPHESYPMLVPDAESVAQGVLIYGINKDELARIVFFEGDEYELSPCQVKTDSGDCIEALFFDEGIMPPAVYESWDFEHWQLVHKDYLLRQSRHYLSYFGKMTAAEADEFWQNYKE